MIMTQTCVLKNGVDLYTNQGERLSLCIVRWSSILCLKEDDKIAHFDTTWLALIRSFPRHSWNVWKVNQAKIKCTYRSLKFHLGWVLELFVLYCTYGSIRPIPTYRVYWLYDSIVIQYFPILTTWLYPWHYTCSWPLSWWNQWVFGKGCHPLDSNSKDHWRKECEQPLLWICTSEIKVCEVLTSCCMT